jgi:Zn-dependent protease/CBS domain-containing protein
MRNWSIPLARIRGVEVRLHLTFLLLLIFVWLTEAATPHGIASARPLALVGIVLASVLLHEVAHAVVGRAASPPHSVVLFPLGGVMLAEDSAPRPSDLSPEIRTALAGPAANLILAALLALAASLWAPQNLAASPLMYSGNLLRSALWVNLFLGACNLLPAYPLDGGRILRLFFLRQDDSIRATRRAITIGQLFSTALIFAGIWYSWLMMAGIFLFLASQLEDRSAVFQSVLQNVSMQDVMLTDFAILSPADTLEDALHKAVHSLQDDFPVIRGSDLVGIISRRRILETLRTAGNGYVQTAMEQAFHVAQRGDSLASAFRTITGKGATLIPVTDGEHLVGIVTLQNLMHSMSLLAETRRLRRG